MRYRPLYVDDFRLDEVNAPKVRLTTADGDRGPDPKMVEGYFGNIDNRRVVWSRGRDLTLDPKQAGGPVNAVAKAHVEIDGKESTDYVRKLTYRKVS